MVTLFILVIATFAISFRYCDGFLSFSVQQKTVQTRIKQQSLSSTAKSFDDSNARRYLNPKMQQLRSSPDPGPFHLKIKGKILNLYGLYSAVIVFAFAALVIPFIVVASLFEDLVGGKSRRRAADWLIHIWANVSLTICGNRCKLYGAENLPKSDEAVVYVPNHTSFLDVLAMSAFIPRPFKYLSKAEIGDLPVIGAGMHLAKHVFLKRNNLQSTIECAELTTQRLKDGNAMVLFAEGTRSPDGKIRAMKKGAFQLSKQVGTKIIPVSLGNFHRYMPPSSLLPIAPMRSGYIKIHPAIDTTGKTVKQIKAEVFEAVNSGLPPYQQFDDSSTAAAGIGKSSED